VIAVADNAPKRNKFSKKIKNILSIQKKAVPLHAFSHVNY
jgi:hypothetical protein